uniref:MCM C-terminal AAA(+) ATPase domain-containing protein n=1 Tax=Amphimedon queenslandica TaxID=400682 RepID=A0A1X7TFN5_AMPQE
MSSSHGASRKSPAGSTRLKPNPNFLNSPSQSDGVQYNELRCLPNNVIKLDKLSKIFASFCPQVFGLYVVKLCICLALVGGVQYVDESGTRVRGDCHLLLVGDPGIIP